MEPVTIHTKERSYSLNPFDPKQKDCFLLRYGVADSPIGQLFAVVHPQGLCYLGLTVNGKDHEVSRIKAAWPRSELVEDNSEIERWVQRLFNTHEPISFCLKGTRFQYQVWRTLLSVEKGETITYTQLADRAGYPTALRAVGSAIGKNPITYFIPCHRILPKQGGVGNYYWGSDMKKKLLERDEKAS